MDDSTKGRYNIIMSRDLLTALVLDYCVVVGGEVTSERLLKLMVDVSNYNYTPLTDKIIKLEE